MSTAIMEEQLCDAINGDRVLLARGCRAELRPPSGVAIVHAGADTGVWHWRNGSFVLSPAEGGPEVVRDTVAEVVRHTREQLCPIT